MKVGEYVRTKDYGFIKVKSFYYNEDMIHILDENYNEYDFSKELVDEFKSSTNIIDLIEVGDYVNGQKVFDKLYDELNKCWYLKLEIGEVFGKYARTYQQHIKSVVTKEMYSSVEYRMENN